MIYERGNTGPNVTLIVMILLVMALFIIGYFKNSRTFWETYNFKELLRLPCGLTVNTPKPNAKILFPISINGYINGCGWIPDTKGGVGTAQVFDAKGTPITKPIPLFASSSSGGLPMYFENQLSLYVPPTTDTGQILFTSSTGLISAVPVSF